MNISLNISDFSSGNPVHKGFTATNDSKTRMIVSICEEEKNISIVLEDIDKELSSVEWKENLDGLNDIIKALGIMKERLEELEQNE